MGEKAYIVLNNELIVIVDRAKALLCEETFKHFTELRWAEKCPKGELSLTTEVKTILTKLSVRHEVISVCDGNSLRCMQLWPDQNTVAPVPPQPGKSKDDYPFG